MKALTIVSLVIASSVVLAQGGSVAATPVSGGQGTKINMNEKIFDPTRDSAKDIADAVKLATKQKKRILLDVGGNWCSWCHKLDDLFKGDKEIASMLKKYVVVKVNFSQENKNEAVLSKYPAISGYPHIFVLEKDGKLLHSQDTGLLESGDHHDPAKVKEFLNKWVK